MRCGGVGVITYYSIKHQTKIFRVVECWVVGSVVFLLGKKCSEMITEKKYEGNWVICTKVENLHKKWTHIMSDRSKIELCNWVFTEN